MTAIESDPTLAATWFIDHESDAVGTFADESLAEVAADADTTTKAVALFHAVRDRIRYDPYGIDYSREGFKASSVAVAETNWCVPKSVLLAACARREGIPARLGFADVKNHLTSEKLSAQMGTDLFAWHGYAELLLPDPESPGDHRWFKLSTAFNIELCERFGVKVLEFDGTADALMHAFDEAGNRHMEYVNQRGSFDDLPLDTIIADFAEIYGTAFGDPGDAGDVGRQRPASAEDAGDDAFSA